MDNNSVIDVEPVRSKPLKPAMSREQALSWISAARICLVIVLGFEVASNVISVVFSLNKAGIGYDILDSAFALMMVGSAYLANKRVKQAVEVLK